MRISVRIKLLVVTCINVAAGVPVHWLMRDIVALVGHHIWGTAGGQVTWEGGGLVSIIVSCGRCGEANEWVPIPLPIMGKRSVPIVRDGRGGMGGTKHG